MHARGAVSFRFSFPQQLSAEMISHMPGDLSGIISFFKKDSSALLKTL